MIIKSTINTSAAETESELNSVSGNYIEELMDLYRLVCGALILLPWDSTPMASPRHSIPPGLSGSSFPPSSVSPTPQRASRALPRSPVPSALPWTSGSPVSPLLCGCSAPSLAPHPPEQSPSVGPLVLLALPPPWLLPLSTPPWVIILAGLWSTIWLLLLRPPPWLHPPSTPP
ncbi:uncharacterized protein LOC127946454 [Carassius gibelio]|uniref:uncharacterized protein LOC127946454 n=1 Tax=Carassius gibelio TaxID=101364 RepID=UPI002278BDB8|nr:uncharacterized protein LOC127946454 [Carassius gibelio]